MITLTEAAVSQVKEMMSAEGEENLFLRIGVKGGGCTGLTYGMGFDNEKADNDQVIEIDGLSLLVDDESAPVVEGLIIDYKQNMMGGGFTIDNPNAIASCGCGTSFRTAKVAGTPENC
ncbi:HesB/IscA family protein [Alkalihalobacillus pseudalcaliphilus]|uniref:HesB/IscA family protein n=1 Tax=Alkalihalobacillus pseudalcaliphilus TaxID=79884 RepID=UPI00064DDEC2|nr:iron-sulfur cluster assembly accessory protein [Alkalihalobacillus pseudalcaliphilus]KMK77669.1 hypothetical protein AB990_04215 [Alkalihalobacillus pseudalcaliphilus]